MKTLFAVAAVLIGALAYLIGSPLNAEGQTIPMDPTWNALDPGECLILETDPAYTAEFCLQDPVNATVHLELPLNFELEYLSTNMGIEIFLAQAEPLNQPSSITIPVEIDRQFTAPDGFRLSISVEDFDHSSQYILLGGFHYRMYVDPQGLVCQKKYSHKFCQEPGSLIGTLTITITPPAPILEVALLIEKTSFWASELDPNFGALELDVFMGETAQWTLEPQVKTFTKVWFPGVYRLRSNTGSTEFYVAPGELPIIECYPISDVPEFEICKDGSGGAYFRGIGAFATSTTSYVPQPDGLASHLKFTAQCLEEDPIYDIFGGTFWVTDTVIIQFDEWFQCEGGPPNEPVIVNLTEIPPAMPTPSPTISRTPTEPVATPKPEPDGEAYLPIVTR